MNETNLDKLIDRLQNLPEDMQFDMDHSEASANLSTHPCGSACCIGGHAALIGGITDHTGPSGALRKFLDINTPDAERICYPPDRRHYRATADQAVVLLRHYRETGRVDWNMALQSA